MNITTQENKTVSVLSHRLFPNKTYIGKNLFSFYHLGNQKRNCSKRHLDIPASTSGPPWMLPNPSQHRQAGVSNSDDLLWLGRGTLPSATRFPSLCSFNTRHSNHSNKTTVLLKGSLMTHQLTKHRQTNCFMPLTRERDEAGKEKGDLGKCVRRENKWDLTCQL